MVIYAKVEIVSYGALYAKLEEMGVFEDNVMRKMVGWVLKNICKGNKESLDKKLCAGIKLTNRILCNAFQKFLDDKHIALHVNQLTADIEEEGVLAIQVEIDDIVYKDLIMGWKDSMVPEELREWYGEWGWILERHIELLFDELPGKACDKMVAILVNDMLYGQIMGQIQKALDSQKLEINMKHLYIASTALP